MSERTIIPWMVILTRPRMQNLKLLWNNVDVSKDVRSIAALRSLCFSINRRPHGGRGEERQHMGNTALDLEATLIQKKTSLSNAPHNQNQWVCFQEKNVNCLIPPHDTSWHPKMYRQGGGNTVHRTVLGSRPCSPSFTPAPSHLSTLHTTYTWG